MQQQRQGGQPSAVPAAVETVGDYMARPTRASAMRRACGALALLSFASLALYALVRLFRCGAFAGLGGNLVSEVIDLPAWQVPTLVSGVAMAVLAVVALLVSIRGPFARYDAKDALRKGVMAVMMAQPRFGVTPQTPLASVALRCRRLGKGTGFQGLQCWNRRASFMLRDFAGVHPAQLGCFDYDVVGGRLYAFLTPEAKQGYRDHMVRGGGDA